MIWKYLPHLVLEAQTDSRDAFSILLPEKFSKITWKKFMTLRLTNSTLSHGTMSSTGYRGQSKSESNPNTQHLMTFKKSIKREVSQHTILKDENYFGSFKRNLLVTTTRHSCEEVLDAHYIPGHDEDSQELSQQKQYFMYSVFNKVIQSDMGKTIVRKHVPILDAQSVWRKFESHMSTSSKGLNERHRLHAYGHAYMSTTVYDRSWKGNLFSTSMNSSDS